LTGASAPPGKSSLPSATARVATAAPAASLTEGSENDLRTKLAAAAAVIQLRAGLSEASTPAPVSTAATMPSVPSLPRAPSTTSTAPAAASAEMAQAGTAAAGAAMAIGVPNADARGKTAVQTTARKKTTRGSKKAPAGDVGKATAQKEKIGPRKRVYVERKDLIHQVGLGTPGYNETVADSSRHFRFYGVCIGPTRVKSMYKIRFDLLLRRGIMRSYSGGTTSTFSRRAPRSPCTRR